MRDELNDRERELEADARQVERETDITLTPEMLADLTAISRGEAPPARVWWQRPWKPGEPCWAVWVGPNGVVVIAPARIAQWDPTVTDPSSPTHIEGATTPLVEVHSDHFPITEPEIVRAYEELGVNPAGLPEGLYRMKDILPRIVPGETW